MPRPPFDPTARVAVQFEFESKDRAIFLRIAKALETIAEHTSSHDDTKLNLILRNQEKIMADTQATLAALAAANASLDGIQADIIALKDLIAAGGTPQEVADAVNALAAKASGIDAQTTP